MSPSQRSKGERDVLAVRSPFTLGVGAFGATVSSSDPESQFLGGGVRAVVGSQEADGAAIPGAVGPYGELLPIEQFGIGGSDTVGGYR